MILSVDCTRSFRKIW